MQKKTYTGAFKQEYTIKKMKSFSVSLSKEKLISSKVMCLEETRLKAKFQFSSFSASGVRLILNTWGDINRSVAPANQH